MKVRFHNNTVRVRLTQSEVASLAAGKTVKQTTYFSKATELVSSIKPDEVAEKLNVTFDAGQLTFLFPLKRAVQWAQSDEVGIETSQWIDETRALRILIEKDFQCLHGESTENQDAFPNPLA